MKLVNWIGYKIIKKIVIPFRELSLRKGGNHILGKQLKKGDFPFKKIGDFAA